MKAIETRYKGYRFRSRLEARWAVFFDALGIVWEYEKEGFELPNGTRYLPDFWLKHALYDGWGYWVEVKGKAPTAHETRALELLCDQHSGYFVVGAPGECTPIRIDRSALRKADALRTKEQIEASTRAVNAFFEACHWTPPDNPVRHLQSHAFVGCCAVPGAGANAIVKAIIASRGARFEFGEAGAHP